jgi:phage baseplate assembly protein gpV
LSDASFIPGISSMGRVISTLRSDAIVMRQLNGNGYVSIDTEGNVDIDGAALRVHCPVEFMKPVTMEDTLQVAKTLTFTGGMNGSGGESAVATFSGNVTITGDATISSISYSGHIHQEHGDGGGLTGGPQ